MEKRIALIGIIVEDTQKTQELNEILHTFCDIIVARMGVPYRDKGVCVISIVVDGDSDKINKLCGKIGLLKGVSAKTIFSKI